MKNILRKDIVTLGLFFNGSEDVTDYLSKKNPQFCYTNILVESVAATRREERKSLVIPNCMKQHLWYLNQKNSYCRKNIFVPTKRAYSLISKIAQMLKKRLVMI